MIIQMQKSGMYYDRDHLGWDHMMMFVEIFMDTRGRIRPNGKIRIKIPRMTNDVSS